VEKLRLVQWARSTVRELVTTILPAVLLALFINVYVAEAVEIEDGPSMQPNFYVGYRVMTEKITYRLRPPQRGDAIVAEQPGDARSLIKRVVALPVERVEVRNGHTYIDGQPLNEPWVTHFGGSGYPSTIVPPDHVFILGDNRPISHDSRAIGPVPLERIPRRVWLIYWPLNELELVP